MSFAEGADRAARAVAAVLERSPRTLGELEAETGADADGLAALLVVLERHGLVALDADRGSARPGAVALRFARSDRGVADLIEAARPSMQRLTAESSETTNLILPRPGGTEAVAQVDGSHLLGVTNWVGRPLGLHTTAAGKVFLAYGTATLPSGELDAPTAATITDRERLTARARCGARARLCDVGRRVRARTLGGWPRPSGSEAATSSRSCPFPARRCGSPRSGWRSSAG